ncbi:hypothetical protein AKJ09_06910 [Labilithrix luteola]|uniref:Uncharacterized protein n=1 Tax=Labilithrix luteola TaxID=1391654 RepID=A0A0K1Q3P0_9BACT|nr:hypothetical protein AKJ09_06910 [Labilithrix luteola]
MRDATATAASSSGHKSSNDNRESTSIEHHPADVHASAMRASASFPPPSVSLPESEISGAR